MNVVKRTKRNLEEEKKLMMSAAAHRGDGPRDGRVLGLKNHDISPTTWADNNSLRRNKKFRASRAYDVALRQARSAKPNYDRVVQLLQRALTQRDPRAAWALARWHRDGKHVKKNVRRALKLLRGAARDELPEALFDLANCYETGFGMQPNLERAFELYMRGALQGHAQSMYDVGRCFYYGIGIRKNRRLAWIWLDEARRLGFKAKP